MKCPTCSSETTYNGNPFRPFCSERCKLIDLGRWASEEFRMPTQDEAPDADDLVHGEDGA